VLDETGWLKFRIKEHVSMSEIAKYVVICNLNRFLHEGTANASPSAVSFADSALLTRNSSPLKLYPHDLRRAVCRQIGDFQKKEFDVIIALLDERIRYTNTLNSLSRIGERKRDWPQACPRILELE